MWVESIVCNISVIFLRHSVVLLEDIILNCLSLSVVLMYSFAYRVIDMLSSLSSDIVNASSISVFKHKLESVDFAPFV